MAPRRAACRLAVVRRRWGRALGRRGARPDEQDAAARVVDDEAGGVAERARTRVERRAREDEDVDVARGLDDRVLRAPAGEGALRRAAQSLLRGLEQALGGRAVELGEARLGRLAAAAEQAGERAARRLARRAGDAEQRRLGGVEERGRVD